MVTVKTLRTMILVPEEYDDTKEVIIIRKSKRNRRHNGQKKTDKQRYIQNTTRKSIDRSTRTPLKPWVNSGVPEGRAVPTSLIAPVFLP